MNEPETYVLCRRQEAANALGAVAPDAVRGRGVKYLVVPPGESFDRAAQRLRAGDETAHIIFVVEEDDSAPTVAHEYSSVLQPQGCRQFSYEDAMTSDLAALAYAEAFRHALCAAQGTMQETA